MVEEKFSIFRNQQDWNFEFFENPSRRTRQDLAIPSSEAFHNAVVNTLAKRFLNLKSTKAVFAKFLSFVKTHPKTAKNQSNLHKNYISRLLKLSSTDSPKVKSLE